MTDLLERRIWTAADLANKLTRLYEATGGEAFFDPPLIGTADADDPFFTKFKTVIGPRHWTPREALNTVTPGVKARTVIAWVLPVREAVRSSNRKERTRPSFRWAAMRSFGEQINENMRRQLCRLLEESGYAAVAPHLEQVREQYDFFHAPNLASRWSERHVAFTAGLGTFGLSGGLITERGIAVRIGSVVTDLELPPARRTYGDDPFAWCLKCGACARRCPSGSVGTTQDTRDKMKCLNYIVEHVMPHRDETYGWIDLSLGCGLCQTGVPCERKRP